MKLKVVWVTLCVFFIASCSKEVDLIPADHVSVKTQGKVQTNENGSCDFSYPGVSFELIVKAKKVSVWLEDITKNEHHNYYEVIVDGEAVKTIETSNKKEKYVLCEDLSEDQFHTVEVFKRTESFVGIGRFYGFEIENLIDLGVRKGGKKKLLIIGDSFSCGYGNETSITITEGPNTGFHAENENNYMAYGAIASRQLSFDYECLAYSGKGAYRNYDLSEVEPMSLSYKRIFPDNLDSRLWEGSENQLGIIVIKLGTNDFLGETGRENIVEVDSIKFISAYEKLLREVHSSYPRMPIICVVGGMLSDNWPKGRKVLTRVRGLIYSAIEESKLENCHLLEFPLQSEPFGEDWHPSKVWHQSYAKLLTNKVDSIL